MTILNENTERKVVDRWHDPVVYAILTFPQGEKNIYLDTEIDIDIDYI